MLPRFAATTRIFTLSLMPSALLDSLATRSLDDAFFPPTSLEDSHAARRALPLTCCGAAVGAAAVAD